MAEYILQKNLIYSIIFLIVVGFFTSPLSFADSHDEGVDKDGGDTKYSDDGDVKESGDSDKNENDGSSSSPSDTSSYTPKGMIEVGGALDHITPAQKKFLEQQEALEKEKLQLDKEQSALNQELELLRIQTFSLSLTIDQFKNNDVSSDKIEDLEEQLTELQFDKSDLEDSKVYLQERIDAYEKNLKILQESPDFWKPMSVNPYVKYGVESESTSIPPWFKSNAKWWKQGLISDADIVNALETLIIQDVIPLDSFIVPTPASDHYMPDDKLKMDLSLPSNPYIPSYQKDVFGYWSDGLVSDSEILNSIGHLMSEGIISSEKIQTEISQRQSEKWEETDEWTDPSDWPSAISKLPQITNPPYYEETDDWEDPSLPNDPPGENKLTNLYDARIAIFFPDNLEDEFKDCSQSACSDNIEIEILECSQSSCSDLVRISEPVEIVEGGMQQLIPVTVLNIGGINFPISQFALWKWTGECDDSWHYHTPTGHAIAIDGITGIPDPDQENCGFGKVGSGSFAATSFMSQSEIDKFKDRTNSDPLTNEAMMGGSDTGSNTVSEGPGMTSLEEDDPNAWTPYDGPSLSTWGKSNSAVTGDEFDDSDGDGIEDDADPEPEIPNNEFGGEKSESGSLIGKIIDRGDLTVTIHDGGEGGVYIEVGTDGDSEFVIIEIMGVELELEAGTILEAEFR